MQIKNKVAVITWASSGIWNSIAKMLVSSGAKVYVLGQNKPENLDCIFIKTNIWQEQEIIQSLSQINFLDILINNAGIWKLWNVADFETKDLDDSININLKWTFWTCKYSIPKIKDGWCIINISSMTAKKAFASCAVYSMTKAGINILTQTMALELVSRKIRVNAISPWAVNTPIWDKIYGEGKEQILEEEVKLLPLGRMWKTEEIANAVRFVIENDFMTGTILDIDGWESL